MGDYQHVSIGYLRKPLRAPHSEDRQHFALVADLIEAQQAEIERLRAVLDAIDALHQPDSVSEMCEQCLFEWPTCPTHLLLHPEEAHRG